jgi:hypothetical protein
MSADSAVKNGAPKLPIRLATIDNYQGEEADVVLISLVRNNDKGQIGFLADPERVNVLLSRARYGMILLGNAQTLRKGSNKPGRRTWQILLDMLYKGGHVFPGLPTYCQRHPNCTACPVQEGICCSTSVTRTNHSAKHVKLCRDKRRHEESMSNSLHSRKLNGRLNMS